MNSSKNNHQQVSLRINPYEQIQIPYKSYFDDKQKMLEDLLTMNEPLIPFEELMKHKETKKLFN